MPGMSNLDAYEPGFDIPALPGMDEAAIATPCLVLDLDALERNLRKMGAYAKAKGMRLRVHGKMHKSVDLAKLQIAIGGACGVCCQKVSEAEVFVRGGIGDVLLTNELRDPRQIDRLARLAGLGAKVGCCIDDIDNVAELSAAVERHGTTLDCLIEIDCGAGRCGVTDSGAALEIARAVMAAPGLRFAGIQAYQGAAQHLRGYDERKAHIETAIAIASEVVAVLEKAGLPCEVVSGGGTGSYQFEAESGVYTELQCGSYAFMDADYGRVQDAQGRRLDGPEGWENALFLMTSVMSHVRADRAVVDAGLKAQSVDSGLPVVFGRAGDALEYITCSDEHGVVADPKGVLRVNDRLRLVPGHCDPTCNIHDWYVGLRGGKVECVWPVSARGRFY